MKSTTLVLLATAAVTIGCNSEHVLEPAPSTPRVVLTTFRVTPGTIALFPGMTTQLKLAVMDQYGRHIVGMDDAVSYASDNPGVVATTSRGELSAIAPGKAVIAVSMTVNGITERRTVTVDVIGLRGGNFELLAPITESGWGMQGGSYSARLTLTSATGPHSIGTFADLRAVASDGVVYESAAAGTVTTRVDVLGRLMLRLVVNQTLMWEGSIGSRGEQDLAGTFAIGHEYAAGWFALTPAGG